MLPKVFLYNYFASMSLIWLSKYFTSYINSNHVEGDITFCQPEETLLTKVLGH